MATNNPQISVEGGMRNDDGNVLWNMYLDEVKEEDKKIAEAWKEGSSGILVFTGLFSTIVAAFIIEFYKQLSPDSGNQTVALLGQISQQLANYPNGTHSNLANQPSRPDASMIWVIAMWLISLVLSLTSALIATLLQEWARTYIETPNVPREPIQRARVRWFLFLGTELYKMRLIAQMGFSLLHLSVYLFFAGLVIAFHTVNKNVAIAVEVGVGVFGLAYIALSILPCLDVQCPYRTPMSYILWYPLHAIPSFAALCLRWSMEHIPGCLIPVTYHQRILIGWLMSRENAVKTHWRYITNGLGNGIINSAMNAEGDGDRKIVTRLFNLLALGDENKLRRFAASIPRNRVFDLIPPIESGRIVREPLTSLLQSCAAGKRVAGRAEEARKRSLLVCLDAIHYIAKAPNLDLPDLNYMRANFANIGLMQSLWDDSDTAIRFTSRSICALLARQVLRGSLEEQQLRWLNEVTGEPSGAICNADDDTKNHSNLKSFVYGVLSSQVGDLPPEDSMSFKETLAILLDVRKDAHFDTNFDTIDSQNRLSQEVGWIFQDAPQGSREVVNKLRSIFPFLPANTLLHRYAPIPPPRVSTHPI